MASHRTPPVIERLVEAGGAPLVRVVEGDCPIVAVALHAGHDVRPGLRRYLGLDGAERLREEDPHTEGLAPRSATRIEVLRSRFEVDCNRPRARAVYRGPEDAWGLNVWRAELPREEAELSRAVHDTFYEVAREELSGVSDRFGRFIVLDLHSYNHRRDGASGPVADPGDNPEVNVGTARIDRDRWAPIVECFLAGMEEAGFDVRENVKFGGGHFAHWVSTSFPESGCALAIEFKKTFMDEWTGVVDATALERIRLALESQVEPLTDALSRVG